MGFSVIAGVYDYISIKEKHEITIITFGDTFIRVDKRVVAQIK